ncbi:MAG: hypothetical protein ACOC6H_03460 [Thermoproteota archaeon]
MSWKIIALVLILFAAVSAVGVGYTMNKKVKFVQDEGTVVWLNLEGGFWGIKGDDGEHYRPIHLDSEFQTHGLRVDFKAEIRSDLASFHMWGKTVKILAIQKLS